MNGNTLEWRKRAIEEDRQRKEAEFQKAKEHWRNMMDWAEEAYSKTPAAAHKIMAEAAMKYRKAREALEQHKERYDG